MAGSNRVAARDPVDVGEELAGFAGSVVGDVEVVEEVNQAVELAAVG
jgi:hypothetical protein